MVTTAARKVFVDTNVLVYARSALSPFQAVAASRLHALTVAGDELWISRQIIREYLVAMTRPGTMAPPTPMASLVADVMGFLARFQVAEDGAPVTAELLRLLSSVVVGGRQIYDANIVATMLAHGIPNVLTHNTVDFNRFSHHITVIPLIPPPAVP
jgi:predicted nucleic acid-binding protein